MLIMQWKQVFKVVSTLVIYLFIYLFIFANLKNTTCETRKNVFYFTSKVLFDLKFHDVIKCQSMKKKYFSLNDVESKHNLFIKFDQFMSYYKRKQFIKKFYKNCVLKTSSRPFHVCKELSTISIGKWNSWSKLLILDI